ncbi:MAG: glycosyltransferase [Hyphomicrobiales bacterium]
MAPRVLLYVQHLLGIGHLVRASRLAEAIKAAGCNVAVISGGVPVRGFPSQGIASIEIPAIRAADEAFSKLVDSTGAVVGDTLWDARRVLLLSHIEEQRPDILIIEAFPFARRQMRKEILTFVEAARALTPRPVVISSIRDILQENRKPGRTEETIETLNSLFDHVLIHGDAKFARLEETFPRAGEITCGISYTGLVAGPEPGQPAERFAVLVSAGGGAAGGRLIEAALGAAQHRATAQSPWCIITGPNFAHEGAIPPHVKLDRFRPDLPNLLAGAGVSISQAGYNTVCDILRARCRSILVPFAAGGETEQSVRAEKLARLKLAQVVPESSLDAGKLIAALATAKGQDPSISHGLDLDGARHSAEILLRLAAVRRGRSA